MLGVGDRERAGDAMLGRERRVGSWLCCIWVPPLTLTFWEGKESLVAEGLRLILRGEISGSLREVGGEEGR